MERLDKIILNLKLKPHPEGGFFRETYRSVGDIKQDSLGSKYKGKRNYSTCIYFLLTSEVFSAFHRIRQDEIWHFYDGSPISLHIITPGGEYSNTVIGRDIDQGQIPQFIVPGGSWFAATVINKNDYSLVGCTVSPGFDFLDFKLPVRNDLIIKFPQHKKIITKLTKG
ncbi:MAG: cupin domain-containing protein [Bacteroidales bacterium]